jgi:hypothetical protein
MDKRKFAFEQILPYFQDNSLCGHNNVEGCQNLTYNGKMCVVGKNLLEDVRNNYKTCSVTTLFNKFKDDQSKIFIPSSVNILSLSEWERLQGIHDNIATNQNGGMEFYIKELNLFTLEELQQGHLN